jgi:hypothetical protein
MRSFIFLCDMSTEQECLDRNLFGTNAGENQQRHYGKLAVGDRLFLYNFELGTMRGPFTALTACVNNLEPKAWKKSRRSFPWQVRVDGAAAFKMPLSADDFGDALNLAQTSIGLLPSPDLNEEQAERLLTRMRERQ